MHRRKTTLVPDNIDLFGKFDYEGTTPKWDNVHRYSPAPRHRRRLVIKILDQLDFADCLDVGCAQPFLIEKLQKRKDIRVAGCDISEKVILSNKKLFPGVEFFVMDISKTQPAGPRYDLVTCSEVLEHVENWQIALQNISRLCCRWLLVTVPLGKIHPIDRKAGHIIHFHGDELLNMMKELGFYPVYSQRWGFPFHSIYKYAINGIAPDKIYQSFGEANYGIWKRFVSTFLYGLFFVNDLFNSGSQFIALMEKKG